MKLLFITILVIFLLPTFNVGGIPIRIEDLIFIIILVFFPTLKIIQAKEFYSILVLIVIAYFITFSLQIFSGYSPVIQDMNTIFSLVRNIVIFYAALKFGQTIKCNTNNLILIISIGFFISSIISLVQFHNIGGLGIKAYLLFGKEQGITYGINRTVGTVGNPNYAAFFQICGLIGILSLKNIERFFKTFILPTLFILIVWSVYVTFSRTGLITMFLILIAYLFNKKKYGIILFASFILIISLPFLGELLNGSRYEQVANSNSTELLTLNGRVNSIWSKKLEAFYDNPIWGISASDAANSNTSFSNAIYDNSFLYLLIVSGLVGLILNIAFNIKILTYFKKIQDSDLFLYMILLHINIFIFYLTTDLVKGVLFTSFYFLVTGLFISYERTKYNRKNATINFDTNIKLE
jgi:hypothetical protein